MTNSRLKTILSGALIASFIFVSPTPAQADSPSKTNSIFIPFSDDVRGTPSSGFVNTLEDKPASTTEVLQAPVIDSQTPTQNVQQVDSASRASNVYYGDEDISQLPPDVDWESQLAEIQRRLDNRQAEADAAKETYTREQQIAADILFRQNNPAIAPAENGSIYPPAGVGGSSIAPIIAPDASAVDKVIEYAKTQLGVPYVWGGTSPNVGLDCSGFVQWVYKQVGIDLPRTTYDQINMGTPIYNQSDLRAGDLVFPHEGHVGLMISDTEMIHAPQPGDVVKISSIYAFTKGVRLL